MKKAIHTIKKSLLVVTVFTATLSNATEISSAITIKEDLKETALTLNNVKKGNLLSIKDYNGIVLYKELINFTGTYRKGFDLTALPNGDYFFEVDKDLEIRTIPFTVKFNEVVFNKDAEVVTFKPYVRQKDGLLLISKLAPNLEPLSISVYAENNGSSDLVYSEEIENTKIIERIYKLKEGNYKITFNSDNNEFTKFINN